MKKLDQDVLGKSEPLHWTKVTRVATVKGDQDDEDYQVVLRFGGQ